MKKRPKTIKRAKTAKSPEHETQFGVTSLGEKGQVVIPADIRASMKLVKGEKLIAFTHNGSIALVPAAQFEEFAKKFTAMRDRIFSK